MDINNTFYITKILEYEMNYSCRKFPLPLNNSCVTFKIAGYPWIPIKVRAPTWIYSNQWMCTFNNPRSCTQYICMGDTLGFLVWLQEPWGGTTEIVAKNPKMLMPAVNMIDRNFLYFSDLKHNAQYFSFLAFNRSAKSGILRDRYIDGYCCLHVFSLRE